MLLPAPIASKEPVPAGRTSASGVEPLMMPSKVLPRPLLKTMTPVRKPMPSTIASVLITSRTLRASRVRSVRRNIAQPSVPVGAGVNRAIAARIESRSGRRSSSTIRPSARNSTRSVYDAATGSWVTITIVCPNSSTLRRRNPSTSALLVESRLPVGSSAKTIAGRLTSARAHAARCCWPPESSVGLCPSRGAQPDGVDDLVEPRLVGLAAGEVERQQDVLLRGEGRHQVEGLEHEADLLASQPR